MIPNPRSQRSRSAIVLSCLLMGGVLVGCGQTRYVVVETPGAEVAAATVSPSESLSPETLPPVATSPGGTVDTGNSTASTESADGAVPTSSVISLDPAEEQAAIEAAFHGALAFDFDIAFADRARFIDGGDDLELTFEAIANILEGLSGEVRITEVVVTDDIAVATVDVIVDGAEFATELPVDLVRVDAEWKVTRGGACLLLTLAAPCPEL